MGVTDDAVVIDFETKPIARRPDYPPKPAGVSIAEPGRAPEYLAFAHPIGNNCTVEQATRRLQAIYRSNRPLAFHNAKFDLDVAETHLGLKIPDWRRCEDTMYLAFLDDPLRRDLSLEGLTTDVLKRSAVFKHGALRDWILANVRCKPSEWAAHIGAAPAHLAAVRANGDAKATLELYKRLKARVYKRGMADAYDRERRLMPCLLDSERRGVRVAHRRLRRDFEVYRLFVEEVDRLLRKALRNKDLDTNSPKQLFAALEAAGKLSHAILTAKGNPSTSKEALEACVGDKKLLALLKLRGVLFTCVNTFMLPWLTQADLTGGLIHAQWNQVRLPEGGGARTGRVSSSPNLQNLLNPDRIKALLDEIAKHWKDLGLTLKKLGLPLVPQLRDYIVPDDKDSVLLVRDYNQNEMRILAHYEDGALLAKYHEDPTLDVHDAARDLIQEILGLKLDRRPVKDTGFGLVYGLGVAGLAKKLGQSFDEAKELREAYLKAMPGIKDLGDLMKQRAAANEPIRTWGGREYYCEEAKFDKERGYMRNFDYKLVNVLIQGSAADCTKEAVCRLWEDRRRGENYGRFTTTVHDETLMSALKKRAHEAMAWLRETMESVEFDVPMLSDGKTGPTWARLTKYKDKR